MIVGVPSNDFGGQEPGGAKEIAETAHHHYGVDFPIAAKAVVKGPNAHPFYKWAAEARPNDLPRWNFHKYLVGRDGYIADVFPGVRADRYTDQDRHRAGSDRGFRAVTAIDSRHTTASTQRVLN